MKTEWDYTELAGAYVKRPEYSLDGLREMLKIMCLPAKPRVCDIGAGVAHLTIPLAGLGFDVVAVEPNDAMRALGIKRTQQFPQVSWLEGTGEATRQNDESFDLVTFGSSFNVTDRKKALIETARILKSHGWFACMWNHRNLEDPLQQSIEQAIKACLPNYSYGTRREDQTEVIRASGLFDEVGFLEGRVIHTQSVADCIEAWRSHATLQRQAGKRFEEVVEAIAAVVKACGKPEILIPYTTRIWFAQKGN